MARPGRRLEFLDIAGLVQQGWKNDGANPLALCRRLEALTVEQAVLMEQVLILPEDMENAELNAQFEAINGGEGGHPAPAWNAPAGR